MTRFIHDQFAKDYLEVLLESYGSVQVSNRVAAEVREIDVLFTPNDEKTSGLSNLGLLGKFATHPAIFEPFRNHAPKEEICDCLLKLLDVRGNLQREAKRNKIRLLDSKVPFALDTHPYRIQKAAIRVWSNSRCRLVAWSIFNAREFEDSYCRYSSVANFYRDIMVKTPGSRKSTKSSNY